MTACTPKPNGNICPPTSDWKYCRPWELSQQDKNNCYADNLIQESLQIAGATVNVYKLLGVHEQTKLIDLIGNGSPISGGSAANYPPSNAYTTTKHEWRSSQVGLAATTSSSYIGYDFGVRKLPNGRQQYGIDAPERKLINTIRIKQSSTAARRAKKIRVERSEDGASWYGVAIVALPDNDELNMVHFKDSVPSRYWRLRPIDFVGTECDSWGIQALEMYDYALTAQNNIQDKILMENRDRDYAPSLVALKGYYDLISAQTDLSRFGIEVPSASYQIKVNFTATIAALGRPIVIGDIIELPSETQYSPDLRPIKKWLEVSDVTWDSGSYTPGWMPTMLLVTAQPAMASQETQDIFGDLAKSVDSSSVFDNDDGNSTIYQDFSSIDQTIKAKAATKTPERGSEGSNVFREFEPEEIATAKAEGFPYVEQLGFNNRRGLYVEDAIPQNGASYTESDTLPPTGTEGAYHRLTYTGLAKDIPARLFRWSSAKTRWIYLETDRRAEMNNQSNVLVEYTTSPTKKWTNQI